MKAQLLFAITVLSLAACSQKEPEAQGEWIKGGQEEQLKTIEKHFRGFDMAMVETGYRYQELFWAGQDGNWEYADYQLGKIKLAVENGLERRPKRAASATQFLNTALPQMQTAINSKDTAIFNSNFKALTVSCNSCHTMEKVPFFTVKAPVTRQSAIKK